MNNPFQTTTVKEKAIEAAHTALSKRLNTEYRKYWIDNKKEPPHQRRILTGRLITLTLKHITQLKKRIRRRNLSIPLSTVYG